ncbi:MAG: acyltransferase family protein [Lachnospiraceae bacterium]|nr:acyltransferase family protein [Lachnospiraceae bacterium]
MQTTISDTQAQKTAKKRFHSIDFIKGICILFIIITHYAWSHEERIQFLFPFWIDMAVPIFMIISGYFYTKSLQKNNTDSLLKGYSPSIVLGKIIRYSVPFIIAFTLEELLFFLFKVPGTYSLLHLCVTFICGGVGPGSYYYPVLIQLIFYFPIIYMIVRKFDFKGFLFCGLLNILYEVLKSVAGMDEALYRLLIFRYTLIIAYGCYLAMDSYKRHKVLSVLAFGVGVSYIITCKFFEVEPPFTIYWTGTCMWACLFIIPIAVPLIFNKAHNSFIELLGRASYNIFLVQMVYYNVVNMIYPHIPARALQLVFNIVVCLVAGLVFYFIETPITNFVHKIVYSLLPEKKA